MRPSHPSGCYVREPGPGIIELVRWSEDKLEAIRLDRRRALELGLALCDAARRAELYDVPQATAAR